jgi:hypothetical protein
MNILNKNSTLVDILYMSSQKIPNDDIRIYSDGTIQYYHTIYKDYESIGIWDFKKLYLNDQDKKIIDYFNNYLSID